MCACPTRWFEEVVDEHGKTECISGGQYGFKCRDCSAAWMFGRDKDTDVLLSIVKSDRDACEHELLFLARTKFTLVGGPPLQLAPAGKRRKAAPASAPAKVQDKKDNPLGFNEPY